MLKRCLTAVLAAGLVLSFAYAGDEAKVLYGFESDGNIKDFKIISGKSSLNNDERFVSEGKKSFSVDFTLESDYPGIYVGTHENVTTPIKGNWEGYDMLKLDVYNPGSETIAFKIRINDELSTDMRSRFNSDEISVKPNWNKINIPFKKLKTYDKAKPRKIDVTKIKLLAIFTNYKSLKQEATLYFDNIRLEKKKAEDADAEKNK